MAMADLVLNPPRRLSLASSLDDRAPPPQGLFRSGSLASSALGGGGSSGGLSRAHSVLFGAEPAAPHPALGAVGAVGAVGAGGASGAVVGEDGQQADARELRQEARQEVDIAASSFEDARLGTLTGWVIVLDLICLGCEVDFDSPLWEVSGCVFDMFYVVEFVRRMQLRGTRLFPPFQFTLALFSAADILAWGLHWSAWRSCLRYLRLLRSIRIFSIFQVLARFTAALLSLMQEFAWIYSVMGLSTYVCAVFFTLYVQSDGLEEAQKFFPDTWTGSLWLFEVTTMDNWHELSKPFVEKSWLWGFFFVLFITFTAFTMISILTATVSEHIMKATRLQHEQETEMQERRHRHFAEFLHECFLRADTDGNGLLDKQEFLELIQKQVVRSKMEELGVVISYEELVETFDMLDVQETGELSIDAFTAGLSQMQKNLGIKHVLALNYALQRIYKKFSKDLQAEASRKRERFAQIHAKCREVEEGGVRAAEMTARLDEMEQLLDEALVMPKGRPSVTGWGDVLPQGRPGPMPRHASRSLSSSSAFSQTAGSVFAVRVQGKEPQ